MDLTIDGYFQLVNQIGPGAIFKMTIQRRFTGYLDFDGERWSWDDGKNPDSAEAIGNFILNWYQ